MLTSLDQSSMHILEASLNAKSSRTDQISSHTTLPELLKIQFIKTHHLLSDFLFSVELNIHTETSG
jgi:hypothetical protein